MAEATGKDSGIPISELTLGEAESFLTSLMCTPEKTKNEGIFYFTLQLLLLEWSIYFLGAEEDEKGLADQAKEFVAGFDEEKEKLLELQGNECFI